MSSEPPSHREFERAYARELMIAEARRRTSLNDPEALGPHLAAERAAQRVMLLLAVMAAMAVVGVVALVR